MLKNICILLGLCLLCAGTPAMAQTSYTGPTGGFAGKNPNAPPPAPEIAPSTTPPDLPAVFDTVKASNPVTAAEDGTETDADAVADPCAAYADYDSYAVCKDRNMKIQRMKDSQARRLGRDTEAEAKAKALKAKAEEKAAMEAKAKAEAEAELNPPVAEEKTEDATSKEPVRPAPFNKKKMIEK